MTICLATYPLKAEFIHLYFIAAYKVSLSSALRLLYPLGGAEGEADRLFLQFEMPLNLAFLVCFLL